MQSWEKILDEYGQIVEKELTDFLEKEIVESARYHDFIEKLYKELYDYIFRGGKRLASCSTLLVYKGFGKEIDDDIKAISIGIELIRHSILIHDDLVDNDELRRGALTIHEIYSKDKDPRFGNGIAIFSGNLLYSLALKAFRKSGYNLSRISNVTDLFIEGFKEVNESQVLDLLFEYKKPDIDEWYKMASKRAASLFKFSLLIGAILADAPKRDIELLREAAENIGYCFDIQDDIIDTFATEEQYGRKPGGDILKSKKPLHIVYTYMMGDQSQIDILHDSIQKGSLRDLEHIEEIIANCGALDAAKNCSRDHAKIAKKLILSTSINKEAKEFFVSFIEYVEKSLDWYK
ncbi:MAG: polyprenyl synthetase family protein [Candidatus Bathyarchaeota archaeon]|nr:polyprenyl synthetase family protein [Candidatus Bathyarchaeota archaeon]